MAFSDLITPGGIVAAAALITVLIQVLKAAFPMLDVRVSGALMAFVLSGLLYVLAGFVLPHGTPDAVLEVFASWVAVAAAAMGIKSGADHVQEVAKPT